MAKFKINLLTSQLDDTTNSVSFLETTMSEFYDQSTVFNSSKETWNKRKHVYCYTFNEKLALHTNGQKDFSFSMLKNIWIDNEQITNPFVSQIKNGSQILLIDQYDNEYMFTVNNIKYTLGASNITYDVTCQDSFTYQNIRQGSGYTINNEADESDFIGAKTVDWWVMNKIEPECHVSYKYIPLAKGLYHSKDTHNLELFDSLSNPGDVQKVVKPIYTKDDYPELHEPIPFSISGSNSSAALIALADELGLMVNFREHNIHQKGERTNSFIRYFWFEPKRNEKTADLRYSPNINIQSFNFSHAGNSLTSVLNVDSKEVNEEIVSLIPEVPYFFSTLFASTEWDNNLFFDGYFTSVCQEQLFLSENGFISSNNFSYSTLIENTEWEKEEGSVKVPVSFFKKSENAVYLHIFNHSDGKSFIVPSFYDKVGFFNQDKESYFYIDNRYCSPKTSTWDLVIKPKEEDESGNITYGDPIVCNDTYSLIPESLLGTTQDRCYLRIKLPMTSNFPYIEQDSLVLIRMYRDVTSEELEFAEIADKCPWLENKLIDFSYFLKQGILSHREYEALLNTINNDLRKINGKLLYYSRDYYNAVRKKTEIISNLNITLDSIGAAFNSDVVEPFRVTGSINDIKYFEEAYSTMNIKYNKTSEQTPISNYNSLLTEYVNKYIKAQQRFLKNLYEFKKFFNQKIRWSTPDAAIYLNTLSFAVLGENDGITTEYDTKIKEDGSVENVGLIKRYLSFDEVTQFKQINNSFNMYKSTTTLEPLIKIYKSDKKTEAVVVHKDNYTFFYKNTINAGSLVRCGENSGFNSNQLYYRVAYVAKKGSIKWPNSFSISSNKTDWYKLKEDETEIWYCSAKPSSSWADLDWPSSITYGENVLIKTFVEVEYRDIVNDYVYKKFLQEPDLNWCYYNTNTNEHVSKWLDEKELQNLFKFSPLVFNATLMKAKTGNYSKLSKKITDLSKGDSVSDLNKNDERIELYKAFFPVTSVTYTGPNYIQSQFSFNNLTYDYQPANSKGQTLTKYVSYLKNSKIYKKTDVKTIISPFATSEYVSYSIPVVNSENESKYYRRVPKGGAVALSVASSVVSTMLGLTSPLAFGIATLIQYASYRNLMESDTDWTTEGWNTKNFDDESYQNHFTGWHDEKTVNYSNSATAYEEYYGMTQQREGLGYDVGDVRVILDTDSDASNEDWTDVETISKGTEKWKVQYKKHSSYKDYYNYYSKIAFTYSSARELKLDRGKTLTFKNSFLRPIKITEKINSNFRYRILSLKDSANKNIIFNDGVTINNFLDADGRISKILYYFLYNNSASVSFENINLKNSPTWSQAHSGWSQSDYVITAGSKKFIIFQEEDFKREKVLYYNQFNTLSDNTKGLSFERRFSIYSLKKVYGPDHVAIDFDKIANLTEGFYKYAEQDSGFEPFTEKDTILWEDEVKNNITTPATKFYRKNEKGQFERAYTINQIKSLGNFYYLNAINHTEETLSPTLTFSARVYLHQEYYKIEKTNNNTTYTLDSDLNKSFIESSRATFEFSAEGTTKKIIVKNNKGKEFSRNCTFSYPTPEKLSGLTNGHFWYLYHSRTESALLFEEAAVIESQLTEFWEKAYNASLYCEYFLPRHWQSKAEGDINHYSKSIIMVDSSSNVPYLSSKYIPNIKIYNNGFTSLLPKYELQYDPSYNNSYTLDSLKQNINTEGYSNASAVLKNNIPFINALAELNETLSNFTVPNYSLIENRGMLLTNYYYVDREEDSGTKWNNFLSTHSSNSTNFENFSGLYVMAYKILKSQFKDRGISRYEYYKDKQNELWDDIYKEYPGVMFEGSFSSETASSSKELLLLAENAFKDKKNPERSYSISLINAYDNLYLNTRYENGAQKHKLNHTKYSGQELKIGDGILVDVDEYYDNYDDIYNTLSQYLFITDITYDLRKDSDISLTVNNIKYQDKLIQRLVKLIK